MGEEEAVSTEEGYSRRGFLKTAAAVGATGAATNLSGCLNSTKASSEEDFVWWTMRGYINEETEAIKEAATRFEDEHDDPISVTTNIVMWDQVFEEWNAAIRGRTTPNVSEMANEHAVNFGTYDIVLPNTELFNTYDDWYDTAASWGAYDGEIWGFPWFIESRALAVNTDLLAEAGHDSIPETWTELISVGADVAEKTDASGFAVPGARDTGTGQTIYSIVRQAGGQYYDYDEENEQWEVVMDHPDVLFAYLWAASLSGDHWGIGPGSMSSLVDSDIEQLYRERRVAMAISGGNLPNQLRHSDNTKLTEETSFATLPTGPTGEGMSFMGGSCLAAFTQHMSDTDVPESVSLEFIEHMTRPDIMELYMTAATPTLSPVREALEEIQPFSHNPTNAPDKWIDTYVEVARNADRYGITGGGRSAPFLGSLETETDAYSIAFSAILGSGGDPKDELVSQANTVRSRVDSEVDYTLDGSDGPPSLENASDRLQPWIDGDGDRPRIWNPYE